MTSRELLTETELAERWGVTTRTLRNWRRAGAMPVYIMLGGRRRYRVEDVREFEAKQRIGIKA